MAPTAGSNIGFFTDVGRTRSENQDTFAVRELSWGNLLVVCDGMGGHLGGRVASKLAAETIVHEVEVADIHPEDPHQVRSLLERCLLRANTEVFRAAKKSPEVYNMGTTAVVVLVIGKLAYVGHVGDSRLYLARSGRAVRLTRDQTAAQAMMEMGHLSADDVKAHPESHKLLQAIGIAPQIEPDVRTTPLHLQHYDSVLLCSDGLYDVVTGREIGLALQKFAPQLASEKLVELANSRGGPDNITIVTYRREEEDTIMDRLWTGIRHEMAGLPVYLWLFAGGSLALAAVLLGLALR
jgi:PPM family protein phosphatase